MDLCAANHQPAVQASAMKAARTASAAAAAGLLLGATPVKAMGEDEGPTGVALGADALGTDVLAITSG